MSCVRVPTQHSDVPSARQIVEHCPLPNTTVSCINIDLFEVFLRGHPSPSLVQYVCSGFRHGFDIGFVGEVSSTRPRNLLSAIENPDPVTEAIRKELSRGHTSGPFIVPPVAPFHCSPLGAVPKKDGTYRIILDLSSPRGWAVNEGISKDDFSVKYSSFDDAVTLVRSLGKDAFMAKLDIKHAFRLCPVRQDQWGLLGYSWQGQFFVDTRLPFGSRSSPFIFNTFADLLLWILIYVGGLRCVVHYLDDFFLCTPSSSLCKTDMDVMSDLFSSLGVPLAVDKTVGPAQCLTFLGIEIDSTSLSIRLPSDKFQELSALLRVWVGRKKCTKRELLSLIGSLSFACKCVKPGRMFLRRLITLSTKVTSLSHHISLNAEARADIQWWIDFLPTWNGVSYIQSEPTSSVAMQLYTDASNIGMGGFLGDSWFSCPWPTPWQGQHINVKELFAIVAATFLWGKEWKDKQILFFTDNLPITHVWLSGSSPNPQLMKLVRHLFLFCARLNINILMQHIPGQSNAAADALSRLQVGRFHHLRHTAERKAWPLPPIIWTLLD